MYLEPLKKGFDAAKKIDKSMSASTDILDALRGLSIINIHILGQERRPPVGEPQFQ